MHDADKDYFVSFIFINMRAIEIQIAWVYVDME